MCFSSYMYDIALNSVWTYMYTRHDFIFMGREVVGVANQGLYSNTINKE